MVLHFLVNDYGLRQDHRGTYHRVGRWVLAAAVILGWAIGVATQVGEAVVLRHLTYFLHCFFIGFKS